MCYFSFIFMQNAHKINMYVVMYTKDRIYATIILVGIWGFTLVFEVFFVLFFFHSKDLYFKSGNFSGLLLDFLPFSSSVTPINYVEMSQFILNGSYLFFLISILLFMCCSIFNHVHLLILLSYLPILALFMLFLYLWIISIMLFYHLSLTMLTFLF